MIESLTIRRYIVAYFIENAVASLIDQVNHIAIVLGHRFLRGEIVFLKSKELAGRVVGESAARYMIEVYDDNNERPSREEVSGYDLMRKDRITKNEVAAFLLSVTKETPFGRVLTEHVVQDLNSRKPGGRRAFEHERNSFHGRLLAEGAGGVHTAGEKEGAARRSGSPEAAYYAGRTRPCDAYNEKSKRAYALRDLSSEECRQIEAARYGASASPRAQGQLPAMFAGPEAQEGIEAKLEARGFIGMGRDSPSSERQKEAEDRRRKRFLALKRQKYEITQVPRTPWEVFGFCPDLRLHILSVYAFLSTFSEFLKLDVLSLGDLLAALQSSTYGHKVAFNVHSKLIKAISHERRKSGKEGLGELVADAADFVYKNPENKSFTKAIAKGHAELSKAHASTEGGKAARGRGAPQFSRVQWFSGEPTAKNWKQYVKSFVYDFTTLYGIKEGEKLIEFNYNDVANAIASAEPGKTELGFTLRGAGHARPPQASKEEPNYADVHYTDVEIALITDRVLFLNFLIEVCVSGIRFRTYFENKIADLKELEKSRADCQKKIKAMQIAVANASAHAAIVCEDGEGGQRHAPGFEEKLEGASIESREKPSGAVDTDRKKSPPQDTTDESASSTETGSSFSPEEEEAGAAQSSESTSIENTSPPRDTKNAHASISGEERLQSLKKKLRELENALAEADRSYSPNILRSVLGTYGGIAFYLIEESIFYCSEGKVFRIERPHWDKFLKEIRPSSKSDAVFEQNLRKFLKICD